MNFSKGKQLLYSYNNSKKEPISRSSATTRMNIILCFGKHLRPFQLQSGVLGTISAMYRGSTSLSLEILGALGSAVLHPGVTGPACVMIGRLPLHPTAASGTGCSLHSIWNSVNLKQSLWVVVRF